ncbi:hypothetical protein ACQV5M_17415 [Leptospira sp. SA-E8]|uniref:hypothetical protein n=1 Tax=Leptospira sp. SA-E8 TaxID=3422259 RepID=UPI003EBA767D
MGWKGTVRSLVAYSRAVERENVRRQKAYAKHQKELAKLQELEAARIEVEEYENYIELIQTAHKGVPDIYDWQNVALTPKPAEPKKDTKVSEALRNKLNNFHPNFFQRLFKLEEKAKAKLSRKLSEANALETSTYENNLAEWEAKVQEWQEMTEVAKGILRNDTVSYKKAVYELNPFEELNTIGSSITVEFISGSELSVKVQVHGDQVVPKTQKSLLKTGKLSIKDLPVGRRNEIYQDHICSAVLRIGRELFALLPVTTVYVNAESELLDSSTGRLTMQNILSVMLVRETMQKLNYESIDPSDALKNFKNNMNFKKSQGMSPVPTLI